MIIDDEFFVIGSANFADRSMMNAPHKGQYASLAAAFDVKETDSELCVGAVDDRQGNDNVARALRIRLWAEHLRVDQWNDTVRPDLADLTKALSILSKDWGRPVRFTYPNSRLVEARLP
jgi:phosphatidylserine/phosphatidylglycerophosphate/cardiolipin synthase-like enzyme